MEGGGTSERLSDLLIVTRPQVILPGIKFVLTLELNHCTIWPKMVVKKKKEKKMCVEYKVAHAPQGIRT